MIQRRRLLGLLTALPVLGLARAVRAATPEVFSRDGLAIGGTDPVAYFLNGAAVPGQIELALMWHGATWTFATAENMEIFEMNPAAFAPQFGGYCAQALTQGKLSPTVPEAFALFQGRLYLIHDLRTRDIWASDIAANLARATAHWPAALAG